jgi:membrane protein
VPSLRALGERACSVAIRCWEGLRHGDAFRGAAAVAFWFFLSLVPLLVLAGFLIGQVARAKGVDALIAPLLEVAPATAVDLVRKELERLAGGSASSIAPLGVAGFMWTASSGLHNLMAVVEHAYKATPRAWWKQRLISLGCVALVLAAACLAAWMLVQISGVLPKQAVPASQATQSSQRLPERDDHAIAGKAGHPQPAAKHRPRYVLRSAIYEFIAPAVVFGFGALLLAGFFRASAGPAPSGSRSVWPGTAFAVGSWLVVSWGFGAYVASLGNYALYYGSLATVAVTLIWLYLTSLSLVVGAYVNAALEESSGR